MHTRLAPKALVFGLLTVKVPFGRFPSRCYTCVICVENPSKALLLPKFLKTSGATKFSTYALTYKVVATSYVILFKNQQVAVKSHDKS